MPRPPAEDSVRPTAPADRGGRHRRGRSVPPEDAGWDSWDTGSEGASDDAWDDDHFEEGDDLFEEGEEGEEGEGSHAQGEGRHARAAEGRHAQHGEGRKPGEEGAAADRSQGQRVPLLAVPDSFRHLDLQVGERAVRGLLLLAVVVILVLGGRWWWVQQRADAVPVEKTAEQVTAGLQPAGVADAPGTSGPAGSQGTTDPQESAAGSRDGAAGPAAAGSHEGAAGPGGEGPGAMAGTISVVVHVVGEVRRPGVVELPAGARVADAVAAVGGLTGAADQTSLNLARTLVDGEQVWVGAPGEEPPAGVLRGDGPSGAAAGSDGGGAVGGGSGEAAGGPSPLVDLNHATQAELEELPGIGPVTAGHILAWREQHGRFNVVEELMEVSGIGERTFAQLEPLVTVGR